ncbi:MAG TPA: FGGY family carbohydrate kinase [Ilumatobacter sp.]
MSATHLLTVDLGTSGPKAAVVGIDGRVVGAGRAAVTTSFPAEGAAEQDPDEIWAATLASCRSALAQARSVAGVGPADVAAVIPSGQYSSIVPVGSDGRHLAPMVIWMDQRGSPKRIKHLPGYPKRPDSPADLARWLRIHGLAPIEGGIALTHMRWFKYGRPDVYARTATLLEPVDFLGLRFSGRAAANQCSVFMSLTVDNRTLGATRHHPKLVEQSLIDRDRLPELVPVGAELGRVLPDVAAQLGLGGHTVVLSGCNDTQAGAVAAGAFRGPHAGVALGTTGVIVTHAPKRKTDPFTSIFTVPSPIGGCHLVSAENGVAGVGVDHFLGKLVYGDDPFRTASAPDDAYAVFDAAAAAAGVGAHGVMYLPWLRGAIAPKADARMRGGFVNVGLDTDRADLARAICEGVALNFRRLWGPVQKFVGREFSHAVFYGGGANSPVWSAILADVLGVPVHQLAQPRHANAIGTALLGFERLGMLTVDEVLQIPETRTVFEPDPGRAARYDELAARFAQAFERTRPLFGSLNSPPSGADRSEPPR